MTEDVVAGDSGLYPGSLQVGPEGDLTTWCQG